MIYNLIIYIFFLGWSFVDFSDRSYPWFGDCRAATAARYAWLRRLGWLLDHFSISPDRLLLLYRGSWYWNSLPSGKNSFWWLRMVILGPWVVFNMMRRVSHLELRAELPLTSKMIMSILRSHPPAPSILLWIDRMKRKQIKGTSQRTSIN